MSLNFVCSHFFLMTLWGKLNSWRHVFIFLKDSTTNCKTSKTDWDCYAQHSQLLHFGPSQGAGQSQEYWREHPTWLQFPPLEQDVALHGSEIAPGKTKWASRCHVRANHIIWKTIFYQQLKQFRTYRRGPADLKYLDKATKPLPRKTWSSILDKNFQKLISLHEVLKPIIYTLSMTCIQHFWFMSAKPLKYY